MQIVLSALPFAASLAAFLLAGTALLRPRRSVSTLCFFAGMLLLGLEALTTALSLREASPARMLEWLTASFVIKSLVPAAWLGFSLTYSRRARGGLSRRALATLAVVSIVPASLAIGGADQLFHLVPPQTPSDSWHLHIDALGKVLNGAHLASLVVVVMVLEQTFRSAVGTQRWRMKFVMVALALIFGTHIYTRSQGILFATYDLGLGASESIALLIGCVFLGIAYLRTGLAEIDVYPSAAIVRSSLTVIFVSVYLVTVGIVTQVVERFGGARIFELQASVVLLALASLAVLLLSDRLRRWLHVFVVRHFSKAQHDSVRVWSTFATQLAVARDESRVCEISARLISETFDALSVTVWTVNDDTARLSLAASTSATAQRSTLIDSATNTVAAGLVEQSAPFDLERLDESWAEELRGLNPTTFGKGGHRLCLPLRANQRSLGAIVVADRINGALYTSEEIELLACIGDHISSTLANLRLGHEVAQGRELEAFRTMSAFFVHDLKNTASSLNLTLRNLPIHFDDPDFRADAIRAVGNAAKRIDETIGRLSTLRQRPELAVVEVDLNHVVERAVEGLGPREGVTLSRELTPLPMVSGDAEQIQSVVTNLLVNAHDAVNGKQGRIVVTTGRRGDRVTVSVEDNGSGMTAAFVKESLFRPFQSTKTTGIGIGLFQCRAIVRAHGGAIHVDSEVGRGTIMTVTLPVRTT